MIERVSLCCCKWDECGEQEDGKWMKKTSACVRATYTHTHTHKQQYTNGDTSEWEMFPNATRRDVDATSFNETLTDWLCAQRNDVTKAKLEKVRHHTWGRRRVKVYNNRKRRDGRVWATIECEVSWWTHTDCARACEVIASRAVERVGRHDRWHPRDKPATRMVREMEDWLHST